MGGSGGFFKPPSESIEELLDKNDESNTEFRKELNSYLISLLTGYNNRDIEGINQHLNHLKEIISRDLEGLLELKFGGSISKHTYVNGLSDVDVLVTINSTSLSSSSPKEIISTLAQKLRNKLPKTKIKEGDLAVTITYSDGHEVQLLPSKSTFQGIKIASADGKTWSNIIKPIKFAKKLTEVNKQNNGRVVPIIKLFKALNNTYDKDGRLSGYHIESLAIQAFKNYKGNLSYNEMMKHMAQSSSTSVLSPITDSTGQSLHVDDYLGDAGSIKRRQFSNNLKRTFKKMRRAEITKSLSEWKKLIDGD
ncbi:hypothetical protein SAMN05216353_10713 [Halobacillus alkaliphilus]|uniref:Nucleotidyltransferase domain-containing protein n=1 Tax=Halobacillus alkaliphilus TaxID=396056 RepID=A0A1I2L066_9BACI|nr:CBASS oligonucleotide cyclase [Halobacillus alkaliphilus]SFF72595.1 hypothetical protein SAMN05216353_10713 [Halobacillus alkaliphilus]